MKENNLIFKNHFHLSGNKNISIKKSKNFNELLLFFKDELKNKEKTINVLNKEFQFNFEF